MKKMLFIDEITKNSIEECLELQDRFFINDKEDVFFFRITSLPRRFEMILALALTTISTSFGIVVELDFF